MMEQTETMFGWDSKGIVAACEERIFHGDIIFFCIMNGARRPTGTFNHSQAMSACTFCQSGTYKPLQESSASSACPPCPAGTYKPGSTSLASCFPCQEGYYCTLGSSAQIDCLAGFYRAKGATAATPCPQNTYGASAKQTSKSQCSPCPPRGQ
jgi:hypothetical protein